MLCYKVLSFHVTQGVSVTQYLVFVQIVLCLVYVTCIQSCALHLLSFSFVCLFVLIGGLFTFCGLRPKEEEGSRGGG